MIDDFEYTARFEVCLLFATRNCAASTRTIHLVLIRQGWCSTSGMRRRLKHADVTVSEQGYVSFIETHAAIPTSLCTSTLIDASRSKNVAPHSHG